MSDLASYPPPRSLESTRHVVQYSGGAASHGAAKIVVDRHGPDNVTLLFADTLIEDEDLYRFIADSSRLLGVPITRLADGRTPWQVMRDVRYIGNTRVDPCSLVLKRDLLWKWMDEFCDPELTTVYFGIDWTEEHRIKRLRKRLIQDGRPWKVEAPLCEEPVTSKQDVLDELVRDGIDPPRMYGMGFPHNNCGGFCIKAGQAHFKLLAQQFPERYRHHAEQEQALRDHLGKDVAILRDRTLGGRARYIGADPDRVMDYGGRKVDGRTGRTLPNLVPLPLVDLVDQSEDEHDEHDWGGCGCALD